MPSAPPHTAMPNFAKDPQETRIHLILLVILALALGLRLWQLDRPALWEDDYLNLDKGLMPIPQMWDIQKWQGPADTLNEFQPPLTFAMLHLALEVSRSAVAARTVSLTAGILAVLGIFALGRRLFGAQAGLLAAFLLSASLFHIEFSRSIKAYSVFFCFSVWSTFFVHKATDSGRIRDWLGWVLTATCMLYSAYIALPTALGQALWAAAMALDGLYRRRPSAKSHTIKFMASSCAIGLMYLPWLPAVLFIQNMLGDPNINPLQNLSWKFACDVLAEFYSSIFPVPGWFVPVLLAMMAVGVVHAIVSGRTKNLALLFFWIVPPTVAVLLSKSVMTQLATARHLFNLMALVTLLPAAGAWAIGRLPRAGNALALTVGFALCLALSWPQMKVLPELYGRSISLDREYFYWLWSTAPRDDSVLLEGWKQKTKSFSSRWYLPGLFSAPGDFSKPGFHRVLVVENQAGSPLKMDLPEAGTISNFDFGPFHTRTQSLTILSRAPVSVLPDAQGGFLYQDDFSTLKLLSDAYAASNVATNLTRGVLAPARSSLPGEVVYCFKAPEGVTIDKASLSLSAILYKRNTLRPSDSSVEILAGPSRDSMKQAGSIGSKDFPGLGATPASDGCGSYEELPMYQSCSRTLTRIDLVGESGASGKELWLALRFQPGVSEGYLELDDLRLAVAAKGPASNTEEPVQSELANLLANNGVRPWRQGAAALDGLFAFTPRQNAPLADDRLGSAATLAAFRAEHSGLTPAHVLRDKSGQPSVLFFDPPLTLSPKSSSLSVYNAGEFQARCLILSGKLDAPSLQAGSARVDIPVRAPGGSVLMLNSGSCGKLVWSPDFSKSTFDSLDSSLSDNIRPAPDNDNDGGLTCRDDRPCQFTTRFESALPMSRVRLEWYPRVVADPMHKNAVKLSYSIDGGQTFTVLENFTGNGSGKWSDLFRKHSRTLKFPEPARKFMLRAELTGEAAQLWSHSRPVDRMWLEADLDARSIKEFTLPAGEFQLGLLNPDGNAFTIRFPKHPYPFFDSIKYWQ